MKFHTLRLILGDQLNAAHSWYKDKDEGILYVIAELRQETDYVRHHIQKVCAFFAAMAEFAEALQASGKQVCYLTLDESCKFKDLTDLIKALCKKEKIRSFQYQRPDEYRLLKQVREIAIDGVAIEECDSEHFLLSFEQIDKEFKAGKHSKMEFFYRRMRKRFDVLMDGDKPEQGQWNFDQENRGSFKKDDYSSIPKPMQFNNDVKDIIKRIKNNKLDVFGEVVDPLPWPVTRTQAKKLLTYFCRHCLANFGRFQDAMTTETDHYWSLYHSRLSFALNAKLLHPKQVIDAAIEHYETHKDSVNIAQVEGFVRQILGWREYIRGVYWANMPSYSTRNALHARRKLPAFFWSGDTDMLCMHYAIKQSLDYAYAHHIQRLMVTGNFCLLAGIDPRQVDAWYLGIYIDAIEWVEMPNTRGMTQYADGGLVATKPYAASGAYINRMSNYCSRCRYDVKLKDSEDACPLNSMYWHFVQRHADKFENNGRMRMVYRNLQRMDADTIKATMKRADWCLQHLDDL
ncbi:MAG: cryptochrome/photolyase family protein [Gammaproteobacteria bacterium]|nr:cryptochrome/photolyase family protein [Gammaproteobacteria bacterium]MBT8132910.1 cryptochrome/photolyase family protein [Gammaproteobacteria bacterium]NNJ49843.1 cryptochrome/photolyase family protein [Gammaproteobacteria bacterium]